MLCRKFFSSNTKPMMETSAIWSVFRVDNDGTFFFAEVENKRVQDLLTRRPVPTSLTHRDLMRSSVGALLAADLWPGALRAEGENEAEVFGDDLEFNWDDLFDGRYEFPK